MQSPSADLRRLHCNPGGIAPPKIARADAARKWPAQTQVTIKGIHFVQEDSPDEIGQAVAGWIKTLG